MREVRKSAALPLDAAAESLSRGPRVRSQVVESVNHLRSGQSLSTAYGEPFFSPTGTTPFASGRSSRFGPQHHARHYREKAKDCYRNQDDHRIAVNPEKKAESLIGIYSIFIGFLLQGFGAFCRFADTVWGILASAKPPGG